MMPAFVCFFYPFAETKMGHSKGAENCFVPEMLLSMNEMFLFQGELCIRYWLVGFFNFQEFKKQKHHDIFFVFSRPFNFCKLISF